MNRNELIELAKAWLEADRTLSMAEVDNLARAFLEADAERERLRRIEVDWKKWNEREEPDIVASLEAERDAARAEVERLEQTVGYLRTKQLGFYDGTALGEVSAERDRLQAEVRRLREDRDEWKDTTQALEVLEANAQAELSALRAEIENAQVVWATDHAEPPLHSWHRMGLANDVITGDITIRRSTHRARLVRIEKLK